tara:strand:- start:238 stop:669 length:432 start_codon:yes stop_codon:yes gene_type:complete
MKKTFETTPMKILIEELSYTNSAFGTTEEGVKVFLNSRMVERLNIEVSDIIIAHCIPNYEDKRDNIPWRCVRAEKIEETIHDINERAMTDKLIKEYMEREVDWITPAEVAENFGGVTPEDVQRHFDENKSDYEIVQCYTYTGD